MSEFLYFKGKRECTCESPVANSNTTNSEDDQGVPRNGNLKKKTPSGNGTTSSDELKRGGGLGKLVKGLGKTVQRGSEVVEGAVDAVVDTVHNIQDGEKTSSTNNKNPRIGSNSKKTRKCRTRQGKKECQCGSGKVVYEVGKAICYQGKVYTYLKQENSMESENNNNDLTKSGVQVEPGKFPEAVEKYRSAIESASEKTGASASLIAAVIWAESRGNTDVATDNPGNGKKDGGLMQVNLDTFGALQQQHPELQGQNLDDPDINILAGAYYLSDNAKNFNGNWQAALRAYNSGPNDVDINDLRKCTYGKPEYVEWVMSYKETIENGGELPA